MIQFTQLFISCMTIFLISCVQTSSTEMEDLFSFSVGKDASFIPALDMHTAGQMLGGNLVNPMGGNLVNPMGGNLVDPMGGNLVDPMGGNPVNPMGGDPMGGNGAGILPDIDPPDRRKIDICLALADCLIDICSGYETTDRRQIMTLCMDSASPQDIDFLDQHANCQDRVNYVSQLNPAFQQGCAGNPIDPCIDTCQQFSLFCSASCPNYQQNNQTFEQACLSICTPDRIPQFNQSCSQQIDLIDQLNPNFHQLCYPPVVQNTCQTACLDFATYCAPNCPGFQFNEYDYQSACLNVCDESLVSQLNTTCGIQLDILKQRNPSIEMLCNPPPPDPCINACQNAVSCANGFCPGLTPTTEPQMQQACLSMCNQGLIDLFSTFNCQQQAKHLNYFNQNFNQLCARPKEQISTRDACIALSGCANALCPFYLPENRNYLIASCMLEANDQIAYDVSNLSCEAQVAYISGINPVFRNNCPMPPDPVPLDPCVKNCSFVSTCMPRLCPYFPFNADDTQADCVANCYANPQIASELNPLYSCDEKIAYAKNHLSIFAAYCSDEYNNSF